MDAKDFRVSFNRATKVVSFEHKLDQGSKEYRSMLNTLTEVLGEAEGTDKFGRSSNRRVLRGWKFKANARKEDVPSIISVNLKNGEVKEIVP